LKFCHSYWDINIDGSPFPENFIEGRCSIEDIRDFFEDLKDKTQFHRTVKRLIKMSWLAILLCTIIMFVLIRQGISLLFNMIMGFCICIVISDVLALIILNKLFKKIITERIPVHNIKLEGSGLHWVYESRLGNILLVREMHHEDDNDFNVTQPGTMDLEV